MSIFKCKMCGGTLEISENQTTATCQYCGITQTLPRLNDERRANLYDRANHFRRNNEFDKAMASYEQILNDDPTDAEAYWSLVLCSYGIEYVEDPITKKRLPTVNRARFTSVFDDDNYQSALKYADMSQKAIYEQEAAAINEIQRGILAISQKEEPFDVFICYKESDTDGRRTRDSVLAQELYYQLKEEGFKVFFSRITLEDKLGVAYEPYIFAALNSSKVMVVLGTKPAYFNAAWVKNEWNRYLALVKTSGGKKVLIPAYRDMDPYDLPEEFSHLQAQDMSKLGFMQDLIHGIKKIVGTESPKETVVIHQERGIQNVAPLLKRIFIFLEDGNWQEADEYCEKVLDLDPENAPAYLGKLMVDLYVRKQEKLADQDEPFDDNINYQKVLRYGDEKLRATVEGYHTHIVERNQTAALEERYTAAYWAFCDATTIEDYRRAAALFEQLGDYKDAAQYVAQCKQQIVELPYDDACQCLREAEAGLQAKDYDFAEENARHAKKIFDELGEWRDAAERSAQCRELLRECTYLQAKVAMSKAKCEREFIAAATSFEALGTYKDAADMRKQCLASAEKIRAYYEQRLREQKQAAEEKRQKKKKAKKIKILVAIACVVTVVLVSLVVSIISYLNSPESHFVYEKHRELFTKKEVVTITAIKDEGRAVKDGVLTIPQTIDGCNVIGIRADTFASPSVETIVLPSTITEMNAYTFQGCPQLRRIEYQGTAAQWLSYKFNLGNRYEITHRGVCEWSNWTYTEGVDCSTGGEQVSACRVCGKTRSQSAGVGTHTPMESVERLAPTCTEAGHTAEVVCSTCRRVLESSEILPALGHTVEVDPAVPPTCTDAGMTEGTHCAVCAAVHAPQETAQATGHTFGDWYAVTAVTCINAGKSERVCTACGCKETEFILAKGHDFGAWEITANATCGTDGSQVKCCASCGLEETEIILTFGHTYEDLICVRCGREQPSEGLIYTDNGEGYTVSRGNCTDTRVVIADYHHGKPVTAIAENAFKDVLSLTSVYIPDTVTHIQKNAFYGCAHIVDLTIPDHVVRVEANAFYGCDALFESENGVTYVGTWAVDDSQKMQTYRLRAGTIGVADKAFASVYSYPAFDVIVPDGCRIIGNGAFSYADVNHVTLPDTITYIGDEAFLYCSDMTSVSIPDGVTYVGAKAFYQCNRLSYTQSGNAQYLGNSANPYVLLVTADQNYYTACRVESGTKIIGQAAFDSTEFSEIILPEGVVMIGTGAFLGCLAAKIHIPATVTYIGDYAFADCDRMTDVTLSAGITYIGENAFYGCVTLTSITVPGGVTHILSDTFYGCESLLDVTIADGVAHIGDHAFYGCRNLLSITIPITVVALDAYAFSNFESIMYAGTMAQWEEIVKKTDWAGYDYFYTVHCTDGDIQA